jgi:hypothetical protein
MCWHAAHVYSGNQRSHGVAGAAFYVIGLRDYSSQPVALALAAWFQLISALLHSFVSLCEMRFPTGASQNKQWAGGVGMGTKKTRNALDGQLVAFAQVFSLSIVLISAVLNLWAVNVSPGSAGWPCLVLTTRETALDMCWHAAHLYSGNQRSHGVAGAAFYVIGLRDYSSQPVASFRK